MIKTFKTVCCTLVFVTNCLVNGQQDVFLKNDPLYDENRNGEQWPIKCSSSLEALDALNELDLTDKIYVYTGADGNIAVEAVSAIFQQNGNIVMACRDVSKCEIVRDNIYSKSDGSGVIDVRQIDLSSISSIT